MEWVKSALIGMGNFIDSITEDDVKEIVLSMDEVDSKDKKKHLTVSVHFNRKEKENLYESARDTDHSND
jgi:hypothetical protein